MIEQAVSFLLDTLTGFFTALFLLRFLMQWQRVSFANRFGMFVARMTDVVVIPLRHLVPGFSGLDIASLAAAYLFQFFQTAVLFALYGHLGRFESGDLFLPHAIPLLLEPLRGTLRVALHLLIALLLLHALLSWTNPYSPAGEPIARLTRPFLRPIRRFIPLIANIDLSPLIAFVLARFFLIFL
ncbi:MAG: YggT family protein [Candidatus Accumulibacter sp.]|jgi:YggT family protein|nr:YggT family protein [Accumulibacter sp.]